MVKNNGKFKRTFFMNNTNWDQFKCRSSAICKMMANSRSNPVITPTQEKWISEYEVRTKPPTEPQKLEYTRLLQLRENSKKIILSDTCIELLMEVYAWETQGMIAVNKESLDIMSMRKGKMTEQTAGMMLSIVDGEVYLQHKERISNDFLSGEIDYYLGDDIYSATNVTDIKNAFDYPGFLKKINTGLENGQEEQLQGYGDITGSKKLYVANCLVDNPDEIILDMKWKIAKRFDALTIESPDFLQEWEKWERSMKFSHIPMHQRVHKIQVEPFSPERRQMVYDRVKVCREWLWKFDEMYQKLNICAIPVETMQ
jgi:hypothetical protein